MPIAGKWNEFIDDDKLEYYTEDVKQLLRWMLATEAEERPTISALISKNDKIYLDEKKNQVGELKTHAKSKDIFKDFDGSLQQNWYEFHDFVLRSAQAKNLTDNRGQSFEITKDMFHYCDRQDPRWASIKEKIAQRYSARAVLTEDKIDEIIKVPARKYSKVRFSRWPKDFCT